MLELLTNPGVWLTLLTLIALELVLGVDNLVFISIASQRLPQYQQSLARRVGLSLALITRLLFLASVFWLASLKQPLFSVMRIEVSPHSLLFIFGGAFLLYKTIGELRLSRLMVDYPHKKLKKTTFLNVILQIMFFDIVFSFDSVMTAVGLSNQYSVIALSVIIAILVVMLASDFLSALIRDYPTIKIMALCFLILVGGILILEGFGYHVSKMFIFFTMGFTILTQCIVQYTTQK